MWVWVWGRGNGGELTIKYVCTVDKRYVARQAKCEWGTFFINSRVVKDHGEGKRKKGRTILSRVVNGRIGFYLVIYDLCSYQSLKLIFTYPPSLLLS